MLSFINPITGYAVIGALLLGASAYGVYKYQTYTINQLEIKLKLANDKAISLENNINGVKQVVSKFSDNQQKATLEREKLQTSVSRLETVKAKPGLVSRKIESSYANFHLEKACFSGNKEACNELNKK